MNFSKLISSLFIIVVAIFFVLLGMISLLTPWFQAIRTHLIAFVNDNPLALSLFGIVALAAGLAIAINVTQSTRHQYYRLRSTPHPVDIDENLIQQYLDNYWGNLFPHCQIPNRLVLKNNIIYLVVNLPYIPRAEQKPLLARIENDLATGLAALLGYTNEFYLNASFTHKETTASIKT